MTDPSPASQLLASPPPDTDVLVRDGAETCRQLVVQRSRRGEQPLNRVSSEHPGGQHRELACHGRRTRDVGKARPGARPPVGQAFSLTLDPGSDGLGQLGLDPLPC